jgi:aryl-alcohol dehydrogenase-like predicted oxidoreductase
MRYRPFNKIGLSASAITLLLDDTASKAGEGSKLVNAALEMGINSFELAALNPEVAQAIQAAVKALGRGVLVLTLRIGRHSQEGAAVFTSDGLRNHIAKALAHTGAQHLDAIVLEDPAEGDISSASMKALEAAKSARQIRQIGLSGASATTDKYMRSGQFDLLATGFGVKSGWVERNRIKAAQDLGMTVTGYDFDIEAAPEHVAVEKPKGLKGLFAKKPDAAVVHAYDFMRETRGWTAEELGLAFALTEPALATVRVEATSIKHLQGLAESVERELPSGVAAQIEMARFTAAA